MIQLLIIGFSYIKSKQQETLPVISDIRKVYDHFCNFEDITISVITDIESLSSREDVDTSDLYFLSNIKAFQQYKLYTNSNDFLNFIRAKVKTKDKIIVYYSGHGSKKNIILPKSEAQVSLIFEPQKDQHKIPYQTFRDTILYASHRNGQVLFLMDCCAGNGLDLPFKLDERGIYRLKHTQIPSQKVVCISSSISNEFSLYSKQKGSLFTNEMMNIFSSKVSSYKELVNRIGIHKLNHLYQSVNVYTSRPDLKYIWNWLLYSSFLSVQIEYGSVIIEPHKEKAQVSII